MCCDFAAARASKLDARLAALRAGRPALEAKIRARLLDYYRRRRRLPVGAATALVGQTLRARIIMRGEIEHTLRIAGLLARLPAIARRLAARLRRR